MAPNQRPQQLTSSMLIKTERRQHAQVTPVDNLSPLLASLSYQKHQPWQDGCRAYLCLRLLSTMGKWVSRRTQVTFLTPLAQAEASTETDEKESVMGIFGLYVGNGKKRRWLCHQLEKLGRKVVFLPTEPETPSKYTFPQEFVLSPTPSHISGLKIPCLHGQKQWFYGISNIAFLIVINFSHQVSPCNFEAHSPLNVPDSQRWGMSTAGCPRHKWAVKKKKKANKKKYLLILMFWRNGAWARQRKQATRQTLNSGPRLFQHVPMHFTRGRQQQRVTCCRAPSSSATQMQQITTAENWQDKDVFAYAKGKSKTGAAVNCNNIFKTVGTVVSTVHIQSALQAAERSHGKFPVTS